MDAVKRARSEAAGFTVGNAADFLGLSAEEDVYIELLLRLQTLFPPEQTREYHALCAKSEEETLTDAERERFLALLELRDHQNSERLEIVAEFAQLRGISLREMLAQFKIQPE